MLDLSYVYDVPIPNQFAASLQILKTGHALTEQGHGFKFFCSNPIRKPVSWLRTLGIPTSHKIEIHPILPGRLLQPIVRQRVRRLVFAYSSLGDPDCIIARGPALINVLQVQKPSRPPVIAEIHRLEWVAANEAYAGRRLGARADPLTKRIAQIKQREQSALALADGYLFVSEGVQAAATQAFRLPDKPASVAPSGVASRVRSISEVGGPVDVVFLGKIERRKGVHTAIAVLKYLQNSRLAVIGDGDWMGEAQALAASLGVKNRVEFTGYVPPSRVAGHLARAKIALCPLPADLDSVSAEYTSPMKIVDYMAAGVPVVATDLPSVREAVGCPAAACLVPSDDPQAMADCVAELLEDPDHRQRLIEAGHSMLSARSWNARADIIANLAEEVVTARSK